MRILDNLRNILNRDRPASKGSGGGQSSFGDQAGVYWLYAQCRSCGEPLKARVNLYNDLSLADDGESWIVRKGLIGDGRNLCFQTVEVTLHFNPKKTGVTNSEVIGGKLITAEEYETLSRAAQT